MLMLGWELPPYNSGGLGVACMNLSRALARDGASIDFVVPYTAEHEEAGFMNVLPATPNLPAKNYIFDAYSASGLHNVASSDSSSSSPIRTLQHDYCDFIN